MTKVSTVLFAYEPGLIARLLGAALEAVNAYGVSLNCVDEESCVIPTYQ